MTSTPLSFRLLGFGAVAVIAFVLGRWTARTSPASTGAPPPPGNAPSATHLPVRSNDSNDSAARGVPPADDLAAAAARSVGSLAAEEERERIIEQWAGTDPRGAMHFVRAKLKGDRQAQATAAVLAIWGKNDPEAAWNWVNTEMPAATHHFDTLLEVFGRNSTETAGRFAARFASAHPEAALEVHLAALLGVTQRGDFAGARSLIDGNPSLDPATRASLDNFVAGQWARFAPEDAAAWVLTLPPGPERDQALIGLGETWSDVDPAGAAAFAVGLPSGDTRTLALRQAIAKWVNADPEAARAWVINTKWHEDFDQAVGSVATDPHLMNRDPRRALKWAGVIFDDAMRTRSVGAILFNWYALDPSGAAAYVQTAPDFTPEQRAEMLARLQEKN